MPVAAGTVDLVTAERLHARRFVRIMSPDGSYALHYNTSTLVRIARMKGQWMQPPHFREAMSSELRDEVEAIEGEIDFSDAVTDDAEVEHRAQEFHEYDAHLKLLNKKQLYACPTCYGWAAAALPSTSCPLDVLSGFDAEEVLPYVVFSTAAMVNAHMKKHHWAKNAAEDCTVRAMINHRIAERNMSNFDRGTFDRRTLTTQSYWSADSRFNSARYNRLFDRLANVRVDVLEVCAVDPCERPPGSTGSSSSGSSSSSSSGSTTESSDDSSDDDGAKEVAALYRRIKERKARALAQKEAGFVQVDDPDLEEDGFIVYSSSETDDGQSRESSVSSGVIVDSRLTEGERQQIDIAHTRLVHQIDTDPRQWLRAPVVATLGSYDDVDPEMPDAKATLARVRRGDSDDDVVVLNGPPATDRKRPRMLIDDNDDDDE
jgi:hypothetical protein